MKTIETKFYSFRELSPEAQDRVIEREREAIQNTRTIGSYGREKVVFNPESIPVLVRRLMESDDDNAQSLASSICDTLGIELI
jgi:hypothetical protein